jgi:hypothetical protein
VKRNNGNHQIARFKYPDIELVYVPRIHGFYRLVVHIHPPCGLLRFEIRTRFDFHRHLSFGISHAKGCKVANPLEINGNGNGLLRLRMSRVGTVDGQYDYPSGGSGFGLARSGSTAGWSPGRPFMNVRSRSGGAPQGCGNQSELDRYKGIDQYLCLMDSA